MRKLKAVIAVMTISLLALAGCGGGGQSSSGGKTKVYLDMAPSGNNWQDEAANLAQSVVTSPTYAKKYEFKKVISGTDTNKQISDIQSMIGSGAKLIVLYPSSPTALDPVIEQGCKAGVTFVTYESTVEAPCAYNVGLLTGTMRADKTRPFYGAQSGEELARQMGGKGNLVINRGVAGTSVDKINYDTFMQVMKKYPAIKVVSEFYGQWNPSVSQQEMSKVLASHPQVDAVWSTDGEVGVIKALQAVGKKAIIAGNSSAYFMKMMDEEGWKGVASSSPTAQGGIAMKVGLQVLEKGANSVPRNVEVRLPWVTNDTIKKCTGNKLENGCNYFGGVDDTFVETISDSDLFPEATLDAAKTGKPLTSVTPLPDMTNFEQPPQRRVYTRGTCDKGWKKGIVNDGSQQPAGLVGCVKD